MVLSYSQVFISWFFGMDQNVKFQFYANLIVQIFGYKEIESPNLVHHTASNYKFLDFSCM